MTINEAIKFAKENVLAYTSEMAEFKALAIEALEKQMPKKPVLENTKGIVGIGMWHCPVCKNEIVSDWNKGIANPYCHHCGQAIDWEGIE